MSDPERKELEQLVRWQSTEQQITLRGRIILASAAGKPNRQIAREESVHTDTVRLWRGRWLALQAIPLEEMSAQERLEDAPRPGAPPTITAEQVSKIVALARETPEGAARPISQAVAALDEQLQAWRERPLGRCRYLDARYEKVRQNGQVCDAAVESGGCQRGRQAESVGRLRLVERT